MKYQATFFLKEPKADRETPINVFFHFAGGRVKLGTGQKVHPKHWNPEKQRAKRGTMYETLINRKLDEIALQLATIYMELENSGRQPTPYQVAARFKAKRPATGKPIDLLAEYDRFILESGDRFTKNNQQVHRTAFNHLKGFEKAYGVKLTFERIDSIFFEKLVGYLVRVIGLHNLAPWNIVKSFRAFLRYAFEHGLTSNDDFRLFTKKMMPKGEISDQVYLTPAELERWITHDFSGDPRLDRSRDLFVFQAHTGFRYGDVQRVRPEHVTGDTIRLVTTKNRKAVAVPLLPQARRIWEKYKGELPRLSLQQHNDALKEVAAAVKLNTQIATVRYKGVERVEKTIPKHELISSHTAKRTFVSILRQRGVSVEAIMKITGNNRATIERYILTTETDVSRELERAWSASEQIAEEAGD